MIRTISTTFLVKLAVAILNFLVIIWTSKQLGPEARGLISLFVFWLSLGSLATDFLGGSSLVFWARKLPLNAVLKITFVGNLAAAAIVSALAFLSIPTLQNYILWLFGSVFTLGVYNTHRYINLSNQKVSIENLVSFLLSLSIALTCVCFGDKYTIATYFASLTIGYAISAVLLALFFTKNELNTNNTHSLRYVYKKLTYNGKITQVGNIAQYLVGRFPIYVLALFLGTATTGVFGVAVAVAEALLLLGNAASMVLYAHTTATDKGADNTVLLMRWVGYCSAFGVLVALLLPQSVYTRLFGVAFASIATLLPFLLVGALLANMQMVLSHYMAGKDQFKANRNVSVVTAIIACFGFRIAIPIWGEKGAAITYMLAFALQWVLQIGFFQKLNPVMLKAWWPKSADINWLLKSRFLEKFK